MAEKSTFFNSVNGDRKYTAEDMAAHFAKMLTNGVMPAGTQLQAIESSGMNVAVSAGSAWINGYAYHNDASFVFAIDPADGVLNRVDRIVVRWSKLARSINLTVLKGTPASLATAPDIVRNADYYDLSIATINVNKGITAITQALITDTRMYSDVCGFVSSLIQPDTSGWFVQFETAFNEWFDGVKDMLGNDVAGNLQNQINQLKTDDDQIRALETKLPDDVATALGLDPADDPQVKDGFEALKNYADTKARLEIGSYTGTGTYGKDNPNLYTFNYLPKIAFIYSPTASHRYEIANIGMMFFDATRSIFVSFNERERTPLNLDNTLTFVDNTASWYNYGASSGLSQFNKDNEEYIVVSFG